MTNDGKRIYVTVHYLVRSFYLTPFVPLSFSYGSCGKWRGVHPEGISLDPEIFGIEGHPEGDRGSGFQNVHFIKSLRIFFPMDLI